MICQQMPTRSADVLIQSLKSNTNLEHLDLSRNNITDKSVPAFTDALQNNTTLLSLDLSYNNLKVQTGRKGMLKVLCDVSSLDSIANNSNHTCSMLIAGCNYGGTYEDELMKINALDNEGEKIRYKVVLTLCVLNKELYNGEPSSNVVVGSGRSRRSGSTAISYADAENSEDES